MSQTPKIPEQLEPLWARLSALPLGVWLACAGVVVLYGVWRVVRWHKRWLSWRYESAEAARARRAAQAETDAVVLLRSRGYRILEEQLEHHWQVYLDGQPHEVNIRADLMVSRRGRRYIAEVKSGQVAPSITTAATRRQLLEYRLAYPVDGILLVDMEALTISEVEFDLELGAGRAPRLRWLVAGVCMGASLALLGVRLGL